MKIPRRLLDVTRRLKAKLMLAENKRVTDAEVIETIFSVACANENELYDVLPGLKAWVSNYF